MMQNKRPILILLCALSLPLPAPVVASDDLFSIMFRMMLTMMNVMADAADDGTGGFNNWGLNNWDMGGTNSLGMGMTTMPMMSGISGMNPWSGYGMSPVSGMGMSPWSSAMPGSSWGNPFTGGTSPWMSPGGMNYPYQGRGMPAFGPGGTGAPGSHQPQGQGASLLGGKWYGNSGEVLEVRGNRFRLRAGKTTITGVISIENNIVKLFSPQTGTVTRYTFVRNQTDLILQDASGRLLGYHKRPVRRSGNPF
jgi:hypothetical protein